MQPESTESSLKSIMLEFLSWYPKDTAWIFQNKTDGVRVLMLERIGNTWESHSRKNEKFLDVEDILTPNMNFRDWHPKDTVSGNWISAKQTQGVNLLGEMEGFGKDWHPKDTVCHELQPFEYQKEEDEFAKDWHPKDTVCRKISSNETQPLLTTNWISMALNYGASCRPR